MNTVAREPASTARKFSRRLTILAGSVLLGCVALLVWATRTSSRLAGVSSPERALCVIVGQMMDYREGLTRIPGWERAVYHLLDGPADEVAEAVGWYEELAAFSSDPVVKVQLAILQVESGRGQRLAETLDAWERAQGPLPLFGRIIASVYLGSEPRSSSEVLLQRALVDLLPSGWFRDRFAMQLARRIGDDTLRAHAQQRLSARIEQSLWWNRLFVALNLGVLIVGAAIGAALLRRRQEVVIGGAMLPPPWRMADGVTVLIRGAAVGTAALLPLSIEIGRAHV